MTRWMRVAFCGAMLLVFLASQAGCNRTADTTGDPELQRVTSGDIDVVLLSSHSLRQGRDQFTIEFRSKEGGQLVDVGEVKMTANMPMPGMPMFGNIQVQKTNVPGRYTASSEITMAGSWRLKIEWNGPKGMGSADLSGSVQ